MRIRLRHVALNYDLITLFVDEKWEVSCERNAFDVGNQNRKWVRSHKSEDGGAIFLTVKFGYVHSGISRLSRFRAAHAGEGTRATCSRLLRHGNSLPGDLCEDRVSTALQQGFADRFSELNGIASVTRLAQYLRAVGVGDNRLKVQLSVAYLGKGADGYLATAAKFVEQGSLASCGSSGSSVIQGCEMLPRDRVPGANLNP